MSTSRNAVLVFSLYFPVAQDVLSGDIRRHLFPPLRSAAGSRYGTSSSYCLRHNLVPALDVVTNTSFSKSKNSILFILVSSTRSSTNSLSFVEAINTQPFLRPAKMVSSFLTKQVISGSQTLDIVRSGFRFTIPFRRRRWMRSCPPCVI